MPINVINEKTIRESKCMLLALPSGHPERLTSVFCIVSRQIVRVPLGFLLCLLLLLLIFIQCFLLLLG